MGSSGIGSDGSGLTGGFMPDDMTGKLEFRRQIKLLLNDSGPFVVNGQPVSTPDSPETLGQSLDLTSQIQRIGLDNRIPPA